MQHDDIRRILTARRHELLIDIRPEDELAFAFTQMKGQVLRKIDEAMRRLDDGTFGVCGECGDKISAARLRALPFAARCKQCEETREHTEQRERVLASDPWQLR